MTLNEVFRQIYEQGLENKDLMKYNEEDIQDAITSDNPYSQLKKVFPRDFLPKVYRWLKEKLKNVKLNKEEINIEGGEFRAKLDKYLQKDKGEDTHEDMVEMLVRELMRSIEKWNDYETKPKDLPNVGLK
jgi:hypothetical protein